MVACRGPGVVTVEYPCSHFPGLSLPLIAPNPRMPEKPPDLPWLFKPSLFSAVTFSSWQSLLAIDALQHFCLGWWMLSMLHRTPACLDVLARERYPKCQDSEEDQTFGELISLHDWPSEPEVTTSNQMHFQTISCPLPQLPPGPLRVTYHSLESRPINTQNQVQVYHGNTLLSIPFYTTPTDSEEMGFEPTI